MTFRELILYNEISDSNPTDDTLVYIYLNICILYTIKFEKSF